MQGDRGPATPGGPPAVWHDAPVAGLLPAAVAAVLALAAWAGLPALLPGVLAVQVTLALAGRAWSGGTLGRGGVLLVVAAGAAGDAAWAVAAVSPSLAAGRSPATALVDRATALPPLLGALGLVVLAGFTQQLLRRDGRAGAGAALTGGTTLAALAVFTAAWLPLRAARGGELVAVTVLGAVAVTVLLSALVASPPLARRLGPRASGVGAALGLLGGVLVGVLSAGATVAAWQGAVLGGVAALGALVGLAVAATGAAAGPATSAADARPALHVVLPVVLVGPLAWALGRALFG